MDDIDLPVELEHIAIEVAAPSREPECNASAQSLSGRLFHLDFLLCQTETYDDLPFAKSTDM